ncbi:MAG: protein kinase [Omnitrophica bacterium]|nr:protein kinase [Candidatus Omnitrophota bacterium]
MNFENILLEILEKLITNDKIDIDEYCKKFPQYKDEILAKLRTAEFLKSNFQEEELSGKKLGEYLLLQELGRGGMGIVFLAIQPSLSRLTAVKVLPPSFARDKKTLKNFQEEAKIIAKFNHPNIAPIYSISNEKGVNYIAMGYISGISLKNIIEKLQKTKDPHKLKATVIQELLHVAPPNKKDISQKSISLKRGFQFWNKAYCQFVATIGAEIADALSYAHQSGISHGDIKPSNVLLTNEGMPMIVDFGLSKDIKKLSVSTSKEFTGTLAYAAPEQVKNNTINDKTDIWSLGLTLYELLAFKNPFSENTVKKTVDKILKSYPLPLKHYNKKIPAELEAIILKCLENKPENRYASIAELAKDLNNYLESKPIKAKPLNIVKRTGKLIKRKPVLASLAIGMLLLSLPASFFSYSSYLNHLINKGTDLQHGGYFEQASLEFNNALKLTNKIPFMHKVREQAFLSIGEMHITKDDLKAIEYINKCLTINADNTLALLDLAMIHERLGNYHEAKKCIDRLLQLNPYDSFAIREYINLFRNLKQPEKALDLISKSYKDVLKHYGKNSDFLLTMDAARTLSDIIEISKDTKDSINNYTKIRLFLATKNFDKEFIEEILEQHKIYYPMFQFDQVTEGDGWKNYRNSTLLFTINYPDTWTVVENNYMPTFYAPFENDKDIFKERVNIVLFDITTKLMYLEEYVDWYLGNAKKSLPKFKLLEKIETKVKDKEAICLIYTTRDKEIKLKLKMYIFIHNVPVKTVDSTVVYVLLYTAEEKYFNKYLTQAEKIIKSINNINSLFQITERANALKKR